MVKDAENHKKATAESLKKIEDGIDRSKKEANDQEMKLHEIQIKKLTQEKEVIGESQQIQEKAKELDKLKQENLQKEAQLNQ